MDSKLFNIDSFIYINLYFNKNNFIRSICLQVLSTAISYFTLLRQSTLEID